MQESEDGLIPVSLGIIRRFFFFSYLFSDFRL